MQSGLSGPPSAPLPRCRSPFNTPRSPRAPFPQAASDTYYATLQKFHGWIVTGTFTVALKIVPSRWEGGGCGTAHRRRSAGAGLLGCWPASLTSRRRSPFGREDFIGKVGIQPGDQAALQQMHSFCTSFGAVLAEVQAFLAENGLDDPAKV